MSYDQTYQSPNHEPRYGDPIDLLVVHATAGSFKSAINWFLDSTSKVSAHLVIDKDGRVYQLVPFELAAWHAGESSFGPLGSQAIQNRSIGIELVNANTGRDPYPDAQIAALTSVTRQLMRDYPITLARIVRHADIAPGRKTDPAGFPWEAWKATLQEVPVNVLKTFSPPARFRTIGDDTNVRRIPELRQDAVLTVLPKGVGFFVDQLVEGQVAASSNQWLHAPGLGYIHSSVVEPETAGDMQALHDIQQRLATVQSGLQAAGNALAEAQLLAGLGQTSH